jgi:hypothetical protein
MKKLNIVLKLFPTILSAVKAIEEAVPLPGQGQKKLDLILDVVKQAFDASNDLSQSFTWEGLVAVIVPTVAKIVDLHNQLGLFNKPATN